MIYFTKKKLFIPRLKQLVFLYNSNLQRVFKYFIDNCELVGLYQLTWLVGP